MKAKNRVSGRGVRPRTAFPMSKSIIYVGNHPYRMYHQFNGWDKEEVRKRAQSAKAWRRKNGGPNVIYKTYRIKRYGRVEFVCAMYEPVEHHRQLRPHELPPGAKVVRPDPKLSRSFVSGVRGRERDVTDARLRRSGRRR